MHAFDADVALNSLTHYTQVRDGILAARDAARFYGLRFASPTDDGSITEAMR